MVFLRVAVILICYKWIVRVRPYEIGISLWEYIAYLMDLWREVKRNRLHVGLLWILRKGLDIGLKLMLNRRCRRTSLLEVSALPLSVLEALRLDYNVVMLVEFVFEISTNAANSKSMRLRLAIQQLLIYFTPITIAAHPTINSHKIISLSYFFLCLYRSRRK